MFIIAVCLIFVILLVFNKVNPKMVISCLMTLKIYICFVFLLLQCQSILKFYNILDFATQALLVYRALSYQ